jgi:protein-S-isoprenylcysteine O-methyltransferase Ste14
MGIGAGVFLVVIGLILGLGAVDLPPAVDDVIASTTIGWICVAGGVLALVLGLIMNQQRTRTTHVEERRID